MNVFDFAMEMEDAGQAYYMDLARKATLPGLQTIFTQLAEDEQKHYAIFQKLKEGDSGQTMPESAALTTAQNLFQQLPSGAEGLKGIPETLAAYRHAMKVEADSFRLYEEAAAKEEDADVKALLLKIAAEEYKHFTILENLYRFVNAPNEFLEWGEFSNLGEFRQFGRDSSGS